MVWLGFFVWVRFDFFYFRFIKPKPNRTGRFFKNSNRFFLWFDFFCYFFSGFLGLIGFSGFFLAPKLKWCIFPRKGKNKFWYSKKNKNDVVLSLKFAKIWVSLNIYGKLTLFSSFSPNPGYQLILLVNKKHLPINLSVLSAILK